MCWHWPLLSISSHKAATLFFKSCTLVKWIGGNSLARASSSDGGTGESERTMLLNTNNVQNVMSKMRFVDNVPSLAVWPGRICL